MFSGKSRVAGLALIPVLVDLFASRTIHSDFWQQLVPALYYAAIVMGGLAFGWKAGLALALQSSIAHSLIGYWFRSSSLVQLEAQSLAFLVVAFALIDQGQRMNRISVPAHRPPGETDLMVSARVCSEQLSAIAAELIGEVRTPLSSIDGASFILEQEANRRGDSAEFVRIIRKECDWLNQTFARIASSAQTLPLNCELTEVSSVLNEVIRLSSAKVPDPRIELRTEVAPNVPLVWCDKNAISQVIAPFVASAMSSIPNGGGILLAADLHGEQARIHLKILEQTFRASDVAACQGAHSATFDTEGGLRVVAARRTLLQHGGNIEVEQTGQLKKLVFFTLPIYNEQRQWASARY